MTHNDRAFCCADILCSFSRQLKPIEKLKMKLGNVDELYLVSRIWADSDKNDENMLVSQHSSKPNVTGCGSFVERNAIRVLPLSLRVRCQS